MKLNLRLFPVFAVVSLLLAACGGGSSAPPATSPVIPPVVTPVDPPVVTPPVVKPADPDWLVYGNHCLSPRTGFQPNGLPYFDRQGTLSDELKWVRSFVFESYLWYKELPADLNMADYQRPIDYFAALKTPLLTASGRPKDRFHFTYPTEVWEALSGAGVELGYGLTWQRSTSTTSPRVWAVTLVEPGSPAAAAGVLRGDLLVSVDGTAIGDTSNAGLAAINAGLFPSTAGETHQLALTRAGAPLKVALVSLKVAKAPVQNIKLLATPTGDVGYLQFNDHNAVSERQLVDAFTTFRTAGINDLVLDMRYNGGGYLDIANELAYMIAGPDITAGKIFEQLQPNDKTKADAPMPFLSKTIGYVPASLKAGMVLPYLGLKRVTILTTPGTCSASESVINGLRGVDVEVNLIGGETCGKPYAFVPSPNCGITYFAIQVQGINNKGFGDYADGFAPTCSVGDDLEHSLGDPSERVLAAALSYRANGVCPTAPLGKRSAGGAMQLVRPEAKEISILRR
jgi:carboxyl-terminal processing protease